MAQAKLRFMSLILKEFCGYWFMIKHYWSFYLLHLNMDWIMRVKRKRGIQKTDGDTQVGACASQRTVGESKRYPSMGLGLSKFS